MKSKINELLFRFENWNGWVKLPILAVAILICVLLAQNSAAIKLSIKSSEEPLQVYFFDVGQASSALVVSPNNFSILIDTGDTATATELADSVEYVLSQNGLDDLDILILTHSDSDHVGGATAVLEKFDPTTIFRPLIASVDESDLVSQTGCRMAATTVYRAAISAVWEEDCNVVFHTDTTLQLGGGAVLTMYAPLKSYYSETNSYCPYITIEYASTTFLFTGDATQTRENEFLTMLEENSITLEVDVLEVPHHGSKYSSSLAFLSAISPTYAVVSAGDSTHPTEEVLSRLAEVGVQDVYITKSVGTLCVSVSESGEIVFNATNSEIDITLIVVCLMCFVFVIFKIIDDKSAKKRKYLPNFRRNF